MSVRARFVFGAVAACVMLFPLVGRAANELFVQAGDIKGESIVTGFKDQVQAVAISVSASASSGKPTLGPIAISKEIDRATPVLLDIFSKGKVFPTLVVVGTWTFADDTRKARTRYTLTNARIVDWRVNDVGTGPNGFEQLTVVAGAIQMEVNYFDSRGNVLATTTGSVSGP